MTKQRRTRNSGTPQTARDAQDTLDLRRQSAARAGLVALGIGAGIGLLTSLLAVWTAAQPTPEASGSVSFANIAVLILLGLLIGAGAGAVLAIPLSLSTLVLRPQMLASPGRARLVAACQGAVGVGALLLLLRFWLFSTEFIDGSLLWLVAIPAVLAVAASAAAGPWIANRPINRPPPERPRSGASPRR